MNENIIDIYELSNSDIVTQIGQRFRDYRIALRMTQKDIAEQSGVSVMTIVRFEKGEGGAIKLDTLAALLRTIQRLENVLDIIPEMPESLYKVNSTKSYQAKRVRRRGNEK